MNFDHEKYSYCRIATIALTLCSYVKSQSCQSGIEKCEHPFFRPVVTDEVVESQQSQQPGPSELIPGCHV